MKSVNPKLLIVLTVVLALALGLKVLIPHKKYSTRQFWETATVSTVASVPESALKPGNKNGTVLMWAAMGAQDPAILEALVARGADVNESDAIFGGTPLTAAAGKSDSPEMIATLVRLGRPRGRKCAHRASTSELSHLASRQHIPLVACSSRVHQTYALA
jgi:hypothetical protein